MEQLTNNEKEVIQLLAEAWNAFLALPVIHPDDNTEFRASIHSAQNIVMARVAMRAHPDLFPVRQ